MHRPNVQSHPRSSNQRTKTKCQNRPRSPEGKDSASRSREAETRRPPRCTPCTVKGNREKRRVEERKKEKEPGYYAFPGARYVQASGQRSGSRVSTVYIYLTNNKWPV